MSTIPANQLSAPQKEQLAVSYAAFVLSSQGAEVNAESINAVLKAANLTAAQGLVKAFSKLLATRNVSDFFGSVGSSSGATTSSSTVPVPAKTDAGKKGPEPAKQAPPPPPPAAEEEEDMDMGGLFD